MTVRPTRMIHIVGDSEFGGGAFIILRLAEMAQQLGCRVDVLTTNKKFQEVLVHAEIGVVDLDVIWRNIRPIRDIVGLLRLYHFLRSNNYDIVHTHTSKAGFIGRLAGWLAGSKRVIHTVHGFAFHEESSLITKCLYVLLERVASRWCDHIVTVSNFHREWAIQLRIGNERKVLSIPNGIPIERVQPDKGVRELQAEYRGDESVFIILTAGRLARQKGLEFLIQALPLLKARISMPFKVVLAGSGPLKAVLEEMVVDLGLERDVVFSGFQRNVGNLLASCDLVVLPSLREGLSIALLEGMAAGKPIVTTSIGSNKEVTSDGEGAWLVPPKDVKELANAIAVLMEDRKKAEDLAARGKAIYLERYTEDNMLKRYAVLYEHLLKEKVK